VVRELAEVELSDLIGLAERVASWTKAAGADEAEAYVAWAKDTYTTLQGDVFSTREGVSAGVGVRAVIGRKVGFASASSLEEAKLRSAAEKAVEIARVRPEDPKFHRLPDPVRRPARSGGFDEQIIEIGAADVVPQAKSVSSEALSADRRVKYVVVFIYTQAYMFGVANTRGISCGDRASKFMGIVECKVSDGSEERTGSDHVYGRRIAELAGIGERAARLAADSLGARGLDQPVVGHVLFDSTTASMMLSMLTYGVSARSVQEGRSRLEGKLGKQVASKELTIVDDAWMKDGLGTVAYDGEGVPTTVKPVIEDGMLRNYLYDSYAAHIEGKKSTGNGMRSWFTSQPSIREVNYMVRPSSRSPDDLLSEVELGVYVRGDLMGLGHANYVTGDFSVVATNAFLVRRGSIEHPLPPTTIAGNFYEMLKTARVGSDLRLSPIGKIPSILVSGLTAATRR